jgi:hypothetical protein
MGLKHAFDPELGENEEARGKEVDEWEVWKARALVK